MSESSTRPGVMIYFDDFRNIAEFLTNEQLGVFMKAVVDYAERGEEPPAELEQTVRFAVKSIRSKIDRDAQKYQTAVMQRRYAVYSREVQKRGGEPISFEEWLAIEEVKAKRAASADNDR